MKEIVVTGTGAVASAIVRAIVPAGYKVRTVSLDERGIKGYNKLENKTDSDPQRVEKILKGKIITDPSQDLKGFIYNVPHTKIDLANKQEWRKNPFDNADAVILTAANPDAKQSLESARVNYHVDKNSIDSAIKAGVKTIIFTSSLWRTMNRFMNRLEGELLINSSVNGLHSEVHYAQTKVESVNYLKEVSDCNKDKIFAYIDLGWFPRETNGKPPNDLTSKDLQFWVAECEMQQHYLSLLEIRDNNNFKKELKEGTNLFSFNGISYNVPPKKLHLPSFVYNLESSIKLGVEHEFNVYSVLENKTSDWRKIPLPE